MLDRLLNYTDVHYDGKELVINAQVLKIEKLGEMKENFEEKLRVDLDKHDLSDEKLKLATLTKIDIGKFTGSMEKGMDYYTFKSKFLKAYSNHPKSLLAEWLVNNHLDGKAKECVGSLENIEEIWKRLSSNFGNTEQMLCYQFKKINNLGYMSKQRTFEAKKHYLQSLVNTMQDVYDVATEHGLTGELYYGSQLPKIVGLLENDVQNGWYKIVAEEELKKPKRWIRMLAFLEKKLKIIQTRASESQPIESGDDAKANQFDKKSCMKSNAYLVTEECKLCDEKHPNSNIEFIQCKKFLQMSPKERSNLVRQKKCCLQCLDGRTKWQDADRETSGDNSDSE